MARKLEWEFLLKDGVSGPAKNMAGALGGAKEGFEHLAKSEHEGKEEHESFIEKFAEWEVLKEGIEIVHEFAERVLDLGKEFIKAGAEAASFREDSELAFESLEGSAESGEMAFQGVMDFAAKLPIATKDAVTQAQDLLNSGWKDVELPNLQTAVSDVGVTGGATASAALLEGFKHIGDAGFDDRALTSISREAHVSRDAIMSKISKAYGGVGTEELTKLMAKHQIDKNVAISAILGVIADKEGGALGISTQKKDAGFEGMLQTIKNEWAAFSFDLDKTEGWKDLLGAMHNLVDVLGPDSADGKALRENLQSLFGGTLHELVGDFTGAEGADKVKAVLGEIKDAVVSVKDVVETSIDSAKAFGGEFVRALAPGKELFGPGGHLNPDTMKSVVEAFGKLGASMGMIATDIERLASLADKFGIGVGAGAEVGGAFMGGSPLGDAASAVGNSKWFDYTPTGYIYNRLKYVLKDNHAGGVGTTEIMPRHDSPEPNYSVDPSVPHLAAGGLVSSPTLALIGEGGETEVVTPLSKLRGMGGVSVSGVNFNVDARGLTADELISKLRTEAPGLLADMMEQLALQQGQTPN